MKAGCFTVPASDYLADSGNDVPTLNSTVARVLLSQSPAHARHCHPRLNPNYRPRESDAFDLGRACHAYILESDSTAFAIVEADEWRTKESKAAKAMARASGRIPILAHQFERVQSMATTVLRQIDGFDPPVPFTAGAAEQTLVWEEEGGVWCRARLDWLTRDRRVIWDLKTTKESANPETFSRAVFNMGLDVQDGFYRRGVKALFGVDPDFEFIVVETEPPYAVSRISLAPDALALADRKVSRAINLWRECMETGYWPGYPTRTAYVEAPPWELAKWEDSSEFNEKAIVLEDAP